MKQAVGLITAIQEKLFFPAQFQLSCHHDAKDQHNRNPNNEVIKIRLSQSNNNSPYTIQNNSQCS